MTHRQVYGLDIETGPGAGERVTHADGTGSSRPTGAGCGVDPRYTVLTRAVLSTAAGDSTFEGDEVDLLTALDTAIAHLEPGIIATWNGSGFDLPYLADRAGIRGIRLGLHLAADRRPARHVETLPGHGRTYRAAWYGHRHLDASRLYRSGRRPLIDVDELLHALGRGVRRRGAGSGPADVPGGELTHDAAHAFAVNDARLVRSLVEARLPAVARQVDRITVPGAQEENWTPPPAVAAETVRRVPLSPAHPAVRAALRAT